MTAARAVARHNWPELTRIEALEGDADNADASDRELRAELTAAVRALEGEIAKVGTKVDDRLGKLNLAVFALLTAIIASTVTLVLTIR